MEKPIHYIIHIPKTAGLSLQGLVRRRYKNPNSLKLIYTQSEVDNGFNTGENLEMVMGHFPFGYHKFGKKPYKYHTFLRNPLEHLISHYNYTFDHPERFEFLPEKMNTIFDFVNCPYGYNLQTLYLSGMKTIRGKEEMALEKAKENLEKEFETIGLTEEFNLSLLLLGKHVGWNILYYVRENKGKARNRASALNEEEKDKLNQLLKYDWKLYNFGKQLFKNQIAKHPELNGKLKKFERNNKIFQSLNPYYILLKRFLGKV